MKKLVIGVCTLIEVGCIAGLAAIGLKRNKDCYKAECELINEEIEHLKTQCDLYISDAKVKKLEQEIAELKTKYEVAEES